MAALVNGNDTVEVFAPLDAPSSEGIRGVPEVSLAAVNGAVGMARRLPGWDHDQGFVPVPERGHHHVVDHVHGDRTRSLFGELGLHADCRQSRAECREVEAAPARGADAWVILTACRSAVALGLTWHLRAVAGRRARAILHPVVHAAPNVSSSVAGRPCITPASASAAGCCGVVGVAGVVGMRAPAPAHPDPRRT